MKQIKGLYFLLLLIVFASCAGETTTSTQLTNTTEATTATVVLHLNQDEVYSSASIDKGVTFDLPMVTTDDDHIYVGWSDGNSVLSGLITVQSDMDLFLVQEKISEVFTFDDDYPEKQYHQLLSYSGQAKYLKIPIMYQGLPINGVFANAFSDIDVIEIYIPNNVSYISMNAFQNLNELRKVEFYGEFIGEGYDFISSETLDQMLLEYVDVCTVVSETEDGIITYSDTCPIITSKLENTVVVDGQTYSSYRITYALNDFPSKHSQRIEENAFYNCPVLETVKMSPANVVFDLAFTLTPNLKHITFLESEKYKVIDDVVYSKVVESLAYYPPGLTAESFTVPADIERIGLHAFYGNPYIETIHLSKSVEYVSGLSFYNLQSLTAITVDSENSVLTAQNGILFEKNQNIFKIIKYPEGLQASSYTIPDSITTIDNGCFAYNKYLETVIIPQSVTQIGDGVFAYTTKLAVLDISENVIRLGFGVIENTNIEALIIRRSIEANDGITIVGSLSRTDFHPSFTIYVPDDSYQTYKVNTFWLYYADYIDVLSNYNVVDE